MSLPWTTASGREGSNVPETVSLWSLVPWSPLHLLLPLVLIQRIVELRIAARNERFARAEGAVEAGMNHYPAIVVLHTLWFAGMIAEIIVLSRPINPFWPGLLAIFLGAQALRYWAITTLGKHWNTRILVVPGARAVRSGPYRYMKHPNYVAVVAELLVLPLLYSAYVTAITASVLNGVLLRIRIRTEEEALREIGRNYYDSAAGDSRGRGKKR